MHNRLMKEYRPLWQMLVPALAAILLIMIVCHPVLADGTVFDVSCAVDDSTYISDKTDNYPLNVFVENKGSDFNGTLKIMMYAGSQTEETLAYGQAVSIKAGETGVFQFNIQNIIFSDQAYRIPIRIDLLDEEGHTVYKTVTDFLAESDSSADICVGVVSGDSRISQNISATQFDYESDGSDFYYYSGRVTMQGIDLTDALIQSIDLSKLQLLVIDQNVSEQAWEKIENWLIEGGHLMVAPVIFEDQFDKIPDEQQMVDYGTGKVLVCEPQSMTGSNFIQMVKTLFGDDGLNEILGDSSENYWDIVNMLAYDMWSPLPKIQKYLILLVIYLIIAGPVICFILNKKDKREYLWGLIPCAAVFFSVLIYCASTTTRYTDPFIRYNGEIQLTDEGAVQHTKIALVSPDKGQALFSVSGNGRVAYCTNAYWYDTDEVMMTKQDQLLNMDYDIALAYSDEKTDVLVDSQSTFQEKYFTTSSIADVNGTLEADLTFYNGGFTGTVSNTTDMELNNVFVIYQRMVILLGKLEAGQTITLDGKKVDTFLDYYAKIQFDTDAYSDTNASAAFRLMNQMIQNIDNINNGRTVVGGFSENNDIGIESSQIADIRGLTIVYKDVSVTESGDGWQTQSGIRGTGHTEADKSCYDDAFYFLYGSEIELDYQLTMTETPTYLEWLNVDPSIAISFYNNETGNYDAVLDSENTSIEGEKLGQYVNEQQILRVKLLITYDDSSDNLFVPAFTVTGGERHD